MSLRLTLLMCLLFTFHCTAQAARVRHSHHRHTHHTKPVAIKPTKIKATGNIKRRKRLMSEYQHWKGTSYRLGANSHSAIDCSALTRRLYQEAFAIKLPRTTGEQIRRGKKAKQGTPHIGDLVFFKTGRAQKHVGIYIGENRFIHASRRKGVTISQLTNPYWNQHLLAVRRVLPDSVVR
ncbi:NlpC/P60 family protein [Scandinavium sp. H11S7]|uniref:NlpC/P60 family protein n=1 Tax=Scandinavium hiltneri TaxID=2926519 RepID=A0ABT2E425_9ENTR|nr:NlpC/P60 family protein [Scandinavium hiltneri]MCS2157494.1 NlpC/P60 family protein [Scandinavium hiltneri]MCS2162193.1 NlpC/P60 family protein [Scandinavium hiltneri]